MSRKYIWLADDFLEEDYTQAWISYPIMPRGGHVLLHGKRNIGKTALVMSMITGLVHGAKLYGRYQTEPCKVALVESDMPDVMLHERLWVGYHHFDYPGLMICTAPAMNMLQLDRADYYEEIYDTLQKHNPDVMVWDTLRKVQPLEENDNASPAVVYGKARVMFPDACHVWVHHNKKTIKDQDFLDNEELFAGAGAWIDNADTGIHLVEAQEGRCTLHFTKVRGGPPQRPVAVQLDIDTMMFYRYMPRAVLYANQAMKLHPSWDEEELAFWLAASLIYPPKQAKLFAVRYFENRRDPHSDKYGQKNLELNGEQT